VISSAGFNPTFNFREKHSVSSGYLNGVFFWVYHSAADEALPKIF